ncbi:hypothetical protein [Mesorhizobium sp. M00.F.Ca.ET.216.01.1.1]|uniref:hypothetical protein n=1 Tax=Mesorhizobium sp. M00.F.Ca.ET.216.01.1.1 TaxID=2500528 RepID=UPI000FD7858B|nr:hypothetical protein [Mesorhizobium sp. M00.F.Ca.ET.216.01.1.1]TGQ33387.1 hypothetical protein EN859_026790 [Mesorhizobium sp. M00.F.Ca.ET.216.01.1.1]
MKPISDTATTNQEPVRLLALGLSGREARFDVGAVIGIAASAIHMLQDDLARPCNILKRADLNGRPSTHLAGGSAATLDGFAEPDISAARVINVAAILTSTERISRWGHNIPFELEIGRGLSAAIYGRNEFKSAFLSLVGDAQVALAQSGRFMVNVERTDDSYRELHQEITRDFRCGGNGDQRDRLDARRVFAELLSLMEVARDGGPGIAVALDFVLCRHRLIESEALGATQCVVMRLQRIQLMHGSMAGSRYRQLSARPRRESVPAL